MIEAALQELERRILVVILDEAQNYSQPSLEEVRLLLGLNLPEQPAFALILIGDEYLLASLKLRNQRALYSRLACQISLEPWTPAQCAQYLSAGLGAVGLSAAVLEPAAAERCWPAPAPACPAASACWPGRPGSPPPASRPRKSPRPTSSGLRTKCPGFRDWSRPRPAPKREVPVPAPSAPNRSPPPTNSTAS